MNPMQTTRFSTAPAAGRPRSCGVLLAVGIALLLAAFSLPAEDIAFPADMGIISLRDFGARGDGKHDDTEAVKKAVDALGQKGSGKVLYIPAGTYLVKDTIDFKKQTWKTVIGENRDRTIIRLADNTKGFDNPKSAKPLMVTKKGNEAFSLRFMNLTLDTGKGNPGAIGFKWSSCNGGLLHNIKVISSDPERIGVCGIDTRSTTPGRAYLYSIEVVGFDIGIGLTSIVNGMGYENVVLEGQREAGIEITENNASVIGLKSRNTVPALVLKNKASVALVNAELTGGAGGPAVLVEKGVLFARNVTADGFDTTIEHHEGDKTYRTGGRIDEYAGPAENLDVKQAFPGPKRSLNLPIEQVPVPDWDTANNFANWVNVQSHGAKPGKDCTEGIQKAIDTAAAAGKSTVYFPQGHYPVRKTIRVHGSVRHLVGAQVRLVTTTMLDRWPWYTWFVAEDGETKVEPVILEISEGQPTVHIDMIDISGVIQHAAANTVVMRMGATKHGFYRNTKTGGKAFFLDYNTAVYMKGPQQVWARFWDGGGGAGGYKDTFVPRDEYGRKICSINDGGTYWLAAKHAEGAGHTVQMWSKNGAKTEIFSENAGAHWSDKDRLKPPKETTLFVCEDSEMSLAAAHVAYRHVIEDIRNGWSRYIYETDRAALCVAIPGEPTRELPAVTELTGAAEGLWPSKIRLNWTPVQPDGALGYRILRDGKVLGHTSTTSFQESIYADGRTLTYTVETVDSTGKPRAESKVEVLLPTAKTTLSLIEAVHVIPEKKVYLTFDRPLDKAAQQTANEWKTADGKALGGLDMAEHGRTLQLSGEGLSDKEFQLRHPRLVADDSRKTALNAGTVAVKAVAAGTGLRGRLYADHDFKKLVCTRMFMNIRADWSRVGPHPATGMNDWGVRFTGFIRPPASGLYAFSLARCRGSRQRIWIDDELLLDTSAEHKSELLIHDPYGDRFSKTVNLTAGHMHSIRLEYIDNEKGKDEVVLEWQRGEEPWAIVPRENFYPGENVEEPAPPSTLGNGLVGRYGNGLWGGKVHLERVDAAIDFDWGLGKPADNIGPDGFRVEWTGHLVPPTSGVYTFAFDVDTADRVKLTLDGKQILDANATWSLDKAKAARGSMYLEANVPVSIHAHWKDVWWSLGHAGKESKARMLWKTPGDDRLQVVPAEVLYAPDQQAPAYPHAPETKVRKDGIHLSWPPYKGKGLRGYRVLRDNVCIGSTGETKFTDKTVHESQTCSYAVRLVHEQLGAGPAGPQAEATAMADTTPPAVKDVDAGRNPEQIRIRFSKTLDPATAVKTENYEIKPACPVKTVRLTEDGRTVVLTPKAGTLKTKTKYTLQIRGVRDQAKVPNTAQTTVEFTVDPALPGLQCFLYDRTMSKIDQVRRATPKQTRVVKAVDLSHALDGGHTIRFAGAIETPAAGNYSFWVKADDGAYLWINDKLVVDNGGFHAPRNRKGAVKLTAGRHKFELLYYQGGGGKALSVQWAGPRIKKSDVPADVLFHKTE